MVDAKGLFKGEDHATIYKTFRPDLKPSMVQKIIEFLAETFKPSECDAVDVGCGSGQGTLPLAPYLHHIVGLDPSEAQINKTRAECNVPDNVEFRVGEAENLPFDASSLHLVTVKTALHWFDLPKFFQEVDRVLKPGGVLAVSSEAGFSHIVGHEKETGELFTVLAQEYRPPEYAAKIKLVFNKYRDVTFPYEECIRDESYVDDRTVSVQILMNTMKTRSDVAKFMKEKPAEAEKALKETEEKLMKIVGATGSPEETIVVKQTPQVLVLCRKPQVVA